MRAHPLILAFIFFIMVFSGTLRRVQLAARGRWDRWSGWARLAWRSLILVSCNRSKR